MYELSAISKFAEIIAPPVRSNKPVWFKVPVVLMVFPDAPRVVLPETVRLVPTVARPEAVSRPVTVAVPDAFSATFAYIVLAYKTDSLTAN